MSQASKSGFSQPIRDLVGFCLLAVAVFVSLSLASYSSLDPSFNTGHSTGVVPVRNLCGLLGSYTADALITLFGYAAYAVPVALLALIYAVVFRPALRGFHPHVLGFVLGLAATSLLLQMASGDSSRIPAWGGVTGVGLRALLYSWVGNAGALITGVTLIAASLVLTTGLTFGVFLRGLRLLGALAVRMAAGVRDLVRTAAALLDRLVDRGEREIKMGMEEIRKEPKIELPPSLRIAGKEVATDVASVPGPERREIPIVVATAEPVLSMPSFHTMDEESPEKRMRAGRKKTLYKLPDITLLDSPKDQTLSVDRDELFQNAQVLEKKLKDFGVFGKVVEVQPGPVITMYEFEPAPGVKVHQITRLNDDLALALKALSVRITPLPGKSVIGIEVANRNRQVVYLKDILAADPFNHSTSKLTLAMGKDTSGIPTVSNLRKMPHLLVAGATGSGKSVSINSMIISVLYKSTPEDVRMILVDPKMLELSLYDGIPHLLLPVVTDPRKAAVALRWAVHEMERRYRLMADLGVRNVDGYNRKVVKDADKGSSKDSACDPDEITGESALPVIEAVRREEHQGAMPLIMVVIDELADLMMVASRDVEESIIRLAQMARAAGIHLILATQRPSVDVITGVIKANMPARLSFQVSSKIDSRTILDANGAELLLGAGDLLFLPPGTSKLQRIHGAFVTDNEVKRVTDFWKAQGTPDYEHDILVMAAGDKSEEGQADSEDEDMYQRALEIARTHRVASISMIQRKLRIGYNRAARIVERMESEGLLAPGEVGKPREVILSRLGL